MAIISSYLIHVLGKTEFQVVHIRLPVLVWSVSKTVLLAWWESVKTETCSLFFLNNTQLCLSTESDCAWPGTAWWCAGGPAVSWCPPRGTPSAGSPSPAATCRWSWWPPATEQHSSALNTRCLPATAYQPPYPSHSIQWCWWVLSPTRHETSYSDRRFWVSYILFIIIIRGILVLFIYTTRLASNEIFYQTKYRGADKSLARSGRKQATATEDFDFHISYL